VALIAGSAQQGDIEAQKVYSKMISPRDRSGEKQLMVAELKAAQKTRAD
jgi:hypothetical protein